MALVNAPQPARRPVPVPDEVTTAYWQGAREGVLRLPWCPSCERLHHVPSLSCPSCGLERLEQRDLSGRGSLYSWTTLADSPGPGFKDLVPLVVCVVELDEQERLLITANLIGSQADRLRIGAPVEVVFEQLDDISLPQFRLAEE